MLISKFNVMSTSFSPNNTSFYLFCRHLEHLHTSQSSSIPKVTMDPSNRKMQTTYSNLMLGHGSPKSLISHWPLYNFMIFQPLVGNHAHHVQEIHQENASLYLLILLITYGWMGQECNKSHKSRKQRQISCYLILQLHHLSYINNTNYTCYVCCSISFPCHHLMTIVVNSNPPSQTLKHIYT